MKISYQKRFNKRLQSLPPPIQRKVVKTIGLFQENPHHSRLRNHALKGTLHGFRAISVTGNIRIVFKEESNYEWVNVVDVGTHNQVY